MEKSSILTLLCTILLLTNCKKDEANELVIIKGKVWDDNMQMPIKNLLVCIYDVKCENFACHSNEIVDSTRTDNNGNYEMNYKRKNSNSLYVRCSYPNRSYTHPTNQGNNHQILSPGIYTDKNFILRKTSVLKTRVLVTNNPFPPLKIFDNINAYMVEIKGANKDTIVYLRGVANRVNLIDLVAFSPNILYYRRKTESINLGTYADTINITILADPNTFPITKY
jgi:hypothetical protein